MDKTTPCIADVLDPWLTAYAARRTGRRQERILAVGARARRCIEVEAERLATDPERDLIEWERQFGTPDPAARAIASEALADLALLLTSDAWLPTDPQDRRVQLQVLGAMAQWMSSPRSGWYGSYCSVLDLHVRVDTLRADDRARRVRLAKPHQVEHH